MRILVVSPALPLYWSSAESRWLHPVATGLARRGHEIAVLSVTTAPDAAVQEAYEEMEKHGVAFRYEPLTLSESVAARKVASLRRPHSELLRVPGIRTSMGALMPHPDVVQYEHLPSSWLAEPDHPSITVCHYLGFQDAAGPDVSILERVRRKQRFRAERTLARRAPNIVTFSARLAAQLAGIGANEVTVAPLVLEYDRYAPLREIRRTTGPVVGLIGSMFHRPSRLAAERLILDLAPRFLTERPDISIRIAGWQAHRFLGHLPTPKNVSIVDSVKSPEAFLTDVDVMLYAPTYGTGMKVKVLETLAWGIPVVTNASGREGLERLSQAALPTFESDDDLVAASIAALGEGSRERAEAARNELVDAYTIEESLDLLETAHSRALSRVGPG